MVWKRIVDKSEPIEKVLANIAESIIEKKDIRTIGLLGGRTGIALFLFYYSRFKNDERFFKYGHEILSEDFREINNGFNSHSICNGIAGIVWAIELLSEEGFLININKETLRCLHQYLINKLIECCENCDFDYLHGALGVFVSINKDYNNYGKFSNYILESLYKSCIIESDGSIKWETILDYKDNTVGVNLGLAHGLASNISVMSKIYKDSIIKAKIEDICNNSIKYIFKNRLIGNNYTSLFPAVIKNNELNLSSRMAWCYGDLGIGISLYQYANAINNNVLKNKAVEIFLNSTNRKDLIQNGLFDAGICHGTAGIAHIFNRVYYYTGITCFKESALYWLDRTIEMAYHKDGIAGFKTWHPEIYGGWTNEDCILDGVAGIGLVLLSAVTDIEPKWDECLLLS